VVEEGLSSSVSRRLSGVKKSKGTWAKKEIGGEREVRAEFSKGTCICEGAGGRGARKGGKERKGGGGERKQNRSGGYQNDLKVLGRREMGKKSRG